MSSLGFCLVTGGGSGISKATCLALAKEGARGILVADINLTTAMQTAEECLKVGTHPELEAEGIELDVSIEASVSQVVRYMVQRFGRIDCCVNGAGVFGALADLANSPLESFRRTMDVNVQGTFLVLRAVTAHMATQWPQMLDPSLPARGSSCGSIVNIGAMTSEVAMPFAGPFMASKHAVVGLTKSAAADNLANLIRVNCVCPYFVDTPLVRAIFEKAPAMKKALLDQSPSGRLLMAEEVADLIVFLCSYKSSFMNGSILTMDGALTIAPKLGA